MVAMDIPPQLFFFIFLFFNIKMRQVFGETLANMKEERHLQFFLCPDKQYP